jgi:hypothetical protein
MKICPRFVSKRAVGNIDLPEAPRPGMKTSGGRPLVEACDRVEWMR